MRTLRPVSSGTSAIFTQAPLTCCATADVATLLRSNVVDLMAFEQLEEAAFLELG